MNKNYFPRKYFKIKQGFYINYVFSILEDIQNLTL